MLQLFSELQKSCPDRIGCKTYLSTIKCCSNESGDVHNINGLNSHYTLYQTLGSCHWRTKLPSRTRTILPIPFSNLLKLAISFSRNHVVRESCKYTMSHPAQNWRPTLYIGRASTAWPWTWDHPHSPILVGEKEEQHRFFGCRTLGLDLVSISSSKSSSSMLNSASNWHEETADFVKVLLKAAQERFMHRRVLVFLMEFGNASAAPISQTYIHFNSRTECPRPGSMNLKIFCSVPLLVLSKYRYTGFAAFECPWTTFAKSYGTQVYCCRPYRSCNIYVRNCSRTIEPRAFLGQILYTAGYKALLPLQ